MLNALILFALLVSGAAVILDRHGIRLANLRPRALRRNRARTRILQRQISSHVYSRRLQDAYRRDLNLQITKLGREQIDAWFAKL